MVFIGTIWNFWPSFFLFFFKDWLIDWLLCWQLIFNIISFQNAQWHLHSAFKTYLEQWFKLNSVFEWLQGWLSFSLCPTQCSVAPLSWRVLWVAGGICVSLLSTGRWAAVSLSCCLSEDASFGTHTGAPPCTTTPFPFRTLAAFAHVVSYLMLQKVSLTLTLCH